MAALKEVDPSAVPEVGKYGSSKDAANLLMFCELDCGQAAKRLWHRKDAAKGIPSDAA